MAIRCLIVDDSPRFAQAAKELLVDEGIEVLGCAATGDEAVRLTRELRPELALVDIDLGQESGLDVANRLSSVGDGTLPAGVILISTHAREEFAELIARSTALGFLDAIAELLGGT
jgi:DNA-binding NarL/FixJ family response regulator